MTYKNYNLTIHDIIYDNNFLIYSYTISRKDGKPLEERGQSLISVHASIDEKNLSGYSGGDFDRIKEDDNQISHIAYLTVKPLNLPSKTKVVLNSAYDGKVKKA